MNAEIKRFFPFLFALSIALSVTNIHAKTLEVGDGKPYSRIEDANAAAQRGDVILVHDLENDRPYEKVAVFVQKKNLTFRAAPGEEKSWVRLSGMDFDYSGNGGAPRAIFQFNRGADGCVLEGFELFGAHNESHNGAGVRINQANRTTIRRCSIHGNDMGIMSNGDGTSNTAADQRIEHCEIHHNGDTAEPGQNHNLYLGGTSATVSFCEIHSSLTGHNLKSRAHQLRMQYCFIHDSANREFDLVDAADTAEPESHALLRGNIIVKNPNCEGNRSVIHFGQDGGKDRDGTLYLYFNTIVTPFLAPVVELSAPGAKAELVGNLISNGSARQSNQQVANVRGGAQIQNLTGMQNYISGDFVLPKDAGLKPEDNLIRLSKSPLFVNPVKHDYRLTKEAESTSKTTLTFKQLEIPPILNDAAIDAPAPLRWQYRHPAEKERRINEKALYYGAYGKNK
ncbi:MAG: right-handed parallel beta-helix repeat-containing protein [Pirellulales bacterium]|nr:right-handed parallel beta-helix repeat-containing protein [Pirellulales bacterium]